MAKTILDSKDKTSLKTLILVLHVSYCNASVIEILGTLIAFGRHNFPRLKLCLPKAHEGHPAHHSVLWVVPRNKHHGTLDRPNDIANPTCRKFDVLHCLSVAALLSYKILCLFE